MDSKLLLCKSITLLYRESQLTDGGDNSSELVRTVLDDIQVSDIGIGLNTDREVIIALKTTILEMCGMPQDHTYDQTDLLQRIRMNCGNDEKLYETIKQGIIDDMAEASLKRSIVNMRKAINNHFREAKIGDVLGKASLEYKFKREKIRDVNTFIAELIAQLEPLQMTIGSKDPSVISDIDIGNDEELRGVFTDVVKMNAGGRVYKTGWPALNRMLQGGIRPGEYWKVLGLQHKYKTGFNLALYAQIAMFNKPLTTDPNKKPLLLRISFEDPIVNNLQFLYQYLKYSDTREYVDVKTTPDDEMRNYVKTKLQVNGFHIKMMSVDPSGWSYKSLCNKIIELESQGYSIEGVFLDYSYKLNRIGLEQGPAGHDVLDLTSKLRNFFGSKGIFLIDPHQISTEGKMLLRTTVDESKFVKDCAGRGYIEGSKGIDRIVDGVMWIHLFKHNKETWFSVLLDKHRYPTITDDDNKYFLFKFPPRGMPIPHSPDGTLDESFSKIQAAPQNADDSLFQLG